MSQSRQLHTTAGALLHAQISGRFSSGKGEQCPKLPAQLRKSERMRATIESCLVSADL